MRCQNLSRENKISKLGLAIDSQCQSGIKRHSQRRVACYNKAIQSKTHYRRGWSGMQTKSLSLEKMKSRRRWQFCVESQRPSQGRRGSMNGCRSDLCGQLEAEQNKENICIWGCPSAEYQSPSQVRGACLSKGCLKWLSESEYVGKDIHICWGKSSIL